MFKEFVLLQTEPKFEIIERIGSGGFGQVFKVKRYNTIVACKQIQTDDPDAALKEHKHMTLVKGGPCIASVHEEFEWDQRTNTLSFFMDFYEGKDLDNVVHTLRSKGGRMTEGQILDIAYQIALALEFCHSKNLLHQDMKPMNVLLEKPWDPLTEGQGPDIFVTDFGMSHQSHNIGSRISDQRGTPSYEAPEIRGRGPLAIFSQKSDVYAFGCILYRLCTLEEPDFACGLKPYDISPNYSIDILSLISTMLSWDRMERPTATQVRYKVLQLMGEYVKKMGNTNCQTCARKFSNMVALEKHQQAKGHTNKPVIWVDEEPKQEVDDAMDLDDAPRDPMIMHGYTRPENQLPKKMRPHVCFVCEQIFDTKDEFFAHMRQERHHRHPKKILQKVLKEKLDNVILKRKVASGPPRHSKSLKRF